MLIALIVAFSVLKIFSGKQASNIAQAIKKDDEKALAKKLQLKMTKIKQTRSTHI